MRVSVYRFNNLDLAKVAQFAEGLNVLPGAVSPHLGRDGQDFQLLADGFGERVENEEASAIAGTY